MSQKPDYIFDCNCSNCSKHGVLWGYFAPCQVVVSGESQPYVRADRDLPSVNVHFCKNCGCTTHWIPTTDISADSMGANMRLFEAEELAGIPVHYPDGKNWTGQGAFKMRQESEIFGQTNANDLAQ